MTCVTACQRGNNKMMVEICHRKSKRFKAISKSIPGLVPEGTTSTSVELFLELQDRCEVLSLEMKQVNQ